MVVLEGTFPLNGESCRELFGGGEINRIGFFFPFFFACSIGFFLVVLVCLVVSFSFISLLKKQWLVRLELRAHRKSHSSR